MSKSPHVRQSSILFCCCFSSGCSLPLLRPPSTYKLLFNCDTSDAVICRTKIPFPNSSFSRYCYSINYLFIYRIFFFLLLCMLQAPPPPTSFPCAPVGCRAISLVVCLRHLFHRSAEPRPHMRTASGHFLPLSLSLSQTHARARATVSSDVTLLIKEEMVWNAVQAPL